MPKDSPPEVSMAVVAVIVAVPPMILAMVKLMKLLRVPAAATTNNDPESSISIVSAFGKTDSTYHGGPLTDCRPERSSIT